MRAVPSMCAQFQKEKESERLAPPARAESISPSTNSITAAIAAVAALAVIFPSHEAAAISPVTAVAGPLFSPLNAETPEILRTIVWADFRIAVAFFVVTPLAIFIWSIIDNDCETDAVKRTMIGYWYG